MHTPTRVEDLQGIRVGDIAVGGNRTYALDRQHGNVYSWGYWGRRSEPDRPSDFSPVLEPRLAGLGSCAVAAGREHALVVSDGLALTVSCLSIDGVVQEHRELHAVCCVPGSGANDLTGRDAPMRMVRINNLRCEG